MWPTTARSTGEATVDALSWAWENWARLAEVDNKLGYLYRVGQSATRRYAARPVPGVLHVRAVQHIPDVDPGLLPALAQLSEQQRTAVVLVHAFGWTQTEVAELLDVTVSTVRPVWVLDLDGTIIIVETRVDTGAPAEAHAELAAMLDSIRIAPE